MDLLSELWKCWSGTREDRAKCTETEALAVKMRAYSLWMRLSSERVWNEEGRPKVQGTFLGLTP